MHGFCTDIDIVMDIAYVCVFRQMVTYCVGVDIDGSRHLDI